MDMSTILLTAESAQYSAHRRIMSGSMRPDVVSALGRHIRETRGRAGLTVEALANRSAVSRRMLTQIELGQANPSVATLDRVAAGLDTTFAALLGVAVDSPPHGVEIWATANGSWAFLLSAVDTAGSSIELWKWMLAPGDRYEAAGNPTWPPSIHHVLSGQLEVLSSEEPRLIRAGESAQVPLAQTHTYQTAAHEPCVFIAVVSVPRPKPTPASTGSIPNC